MWLIFAGLLPSVRGVIGLRQVDGMPHRASLVAGRSHGHEASKRHHEQPPTVVAIDTDQHRDQRRQYGALLHTTRDGRSGRRSPYERSTRVKYSAS
jgi:hypothetical protein